MEYCKKHMCYLTSMLDPTDTFCFQCENELKGDSTKNEDGFRICAAPVGDNYLKYYAVVRDTRASPQFCFLFKTEDQVRNEIKRRIKANLGVDFIGVQLETLVECSHWHNNGMSRDTYAVWGRDAAPKSLNGNHGIITQGVVDAASAKKIKQAKLKPKYGGSLNKKPVSSIPTTSPTPAIPIKKTKPKPKSKKPSKAVPKKKKKVAKGVIKTPVKKSLKKKKPVVAKTTIKKPKKKKSTSKLKLN